MVDPWDRRSKVWVVPGEVDEALNQILVTTVTWIRMPEPSHHRAAPRLGVRGSRTDDPEDVFVNKLVSTGLGAAPRGRLGDSPPTSPSRSSSAWSR